MANELIYKILLLFMPTVLIILAAVFIILSIVLNHHWKQYGFDNKNIIKAKSIYLGISGILFLVMIILLVATFL